VLDLCCGSGRHLAGLAELGYEVTGIERDPEIAERARSRVPAAQIVEGDANRVAALVDGPFAGVICLWQSFGYGSAAENAALLGALGAVLDSGGRLVLDVYNRTFLETRTGARRMERAGRSVREHLALEGDRLTSSLDYGSGIEDVFSWQVFTPEELTAAARAVGLEQVLACATFDETVAPSADDPRMQLVFERI
jgi:SAM-dependent methyltransferase